MKRILLLFTVAAMMAAMSISASVASAQEWSSWNWSPDSSLWWWHNDDDRFDDEDFGVFGEFADQELESGDIDTDTNISVEGNNNQCVGLSQVNSTGNFANQQGTSNFGGSNGFFFDDDDNERNGHFFGSFDDDNGEFEQEFEGPEVTFAPENETSCDQAIQQSSAASSTWW